MQFVSCCRAQCESDSNLLHPPHTHTHRNVSCEFLTHFLLHSHGHQILLGTLSLGVETVNSLLKNQYSSPRLPLQVESLKVVFEIIDLLLQIKSQEVSLKVVGHSPV